MIHSRIKKQILLALLVALVPVSTVYPLSWGSLATSFSANVSQLWNRACSALANMSPKLVAVGAVLTAGVVAGIYWFNKKNREIRRLKSDLQTETRGKAIVTGSQRQLGSRVRQLEADNKNLRKEKDSLLKVASGDLAASQARINQLEQEVKERAHVAMLNQSTQTDDPRALDLDEKVLTEGGDSEWTHIEFLTPEVIKERIESLKGAFEQLAKNAQMSCPVDQMEYKTETALRCIKNSIELKKQELAKEKSNLHLIISARTGTVDDLYNCLENEYKANKRAIKQNALIDLDPSGYYGYLDLESSGSSMTSAQIMRIIDEKKRDADDSAKWILRQLGYVFSNNASKEHFDAFLQGKGVLQQLLFEGAVKDDLLNAFDSIEESQMAVEEYLGKLSRCLRKSSSDSNGEKTA